MEIIKYRVNDIIELKKPHPCGSKQFKVLRVGSDIRIICLGCSRDMTVDRIKLEKSTKKIVNGESNEIL
ncbi:MAG: DUF951 domain-containing protein [Clostridia bacterium]|nr:DUF951 domain-containing protein [Clostridia bacterium]